MRTQNSGIASMGERGQSAPLTAKNSQKSGKKRGKNQAKEEKIGKKRRNREVKTKTGKVLSLCPS